MSIATERDVQQLTAKYGSEILALPRVSCYHNALKASFRIFSENKRRRLPKVYGLDLPGEAEHHAYLVADGLVYNTAVTWVDAKYPDIGLEDLIRKGNDRTAQLYSGLVVDSDGEITHVNASLFNFLRRAHSNDLTFQPTLLSAFFLSNGELLAWSQIERDSFGNAVYFGQPNGNWK